MSGLDKTHPEFTISIRGYDRLQVDDYVERLHSLVRQAEERSRAAESELEFSRHTNIGPRVSEIFDLAVAESQELRQKVEREATAMLTDARAQSDEILQAGHRAAEEVTAQARREHKMLMGDLEAERRQVQEELRALREHRDGMLDELRRLHDALGHVTSFTRPAAEAPALAPDTDELPTVVRREPFAVPARAGEATAAA